MSQDLYPLTDEQIADMIEFEKMCEAEYQAAQLQQMWDELQATPSYVELEADAFAKEK